MTAVVPGDRRSNATRTYSGLALAQAAVLALGFVTAPLMARALGPEGRGLLAAIIVPLSVTPWVFQFGTGLFALKEAARGVPARTLLGSLGSLNLIFGVVAAIVGLLVVKEIANGHPQVEHYLVIGFAVMPVVLVLSLVSDILWGLERWRAVIVLRVTPTVFATIGIVVLYGAGELTVATAAIVTILGSLMQIVPALTQARVLGRPRFRLPVVTGALVFGSKGWLGTLAQTANHRLDQLMMIALVSPRELGLYAVAVTISAATAIVTAPIASIALPMVARANAGFAAKATRLGLLAGASGALLVGAVVPFLLPIVFTDAFADAVSLTLLLLVAAVFSSGVAVLGPALAAADRPGAGTVAETVSLAITVPGLVLLLPVLGAAGAALTSIAAYAMAFVTLLVYARRRFGMPISAFTVPRVADVRWLLGKLRTDLLRRRGAADGAPEPRA